MELGGFYVKFERVLLEKERQNYGYKPSVVKFDKKRAKSTPNLT